MSKLVKFFTSKDITKWERSANGSDFRELLTTPTTSNIIELIKIGNSSCNDDDAFDILDNYLNEEEDNNIFTAYSEIVEVVIGSKQTTKKQATEIREGLAQMF